VSPSPYEMAALQEIHLWKNPKTGWFTAVLEALNWPLQQAGDLVTKTPGVGPAITGALQGIIATCNDAAQWTVSQDGVIRDYQAYGHPEITDLAGIRRLDLESCDRCVGWLAAKYKGLALVEGAGTGAAGLPGIPVNVVALLTLNLRAIGLYATYYGFDINNQHERLFALNILGLSSAPSDASKALAMAQLVRIAQEVARKRTWKELEKHVFVQVVQQIAKVLGIRLTKAKLAQVIPIAGVVVGAGYDAYFTGRVCDAAYNLYRERFLAEKYGSVQISAPVKPAEDYTPDYADEPDDLEQLTEA
jgi:hypothetical protein